MAVLGLALALLCLGAPATAELPQVRIGVVIDGPWKGNDRVLEITRREVFALTDGEFDASFPADAYLVGDWSLETARSHLDRLLEDPDVDLVITWGVLSSHAVCCLGALPKPVVAPIVIDRELQGLPAEGGASGVENLTYVTLPERLLENLTLFQALVPSTEIAILAHEALLEAVPDLPLRTGPIATQVGASLRYVGVGRSADETLAKIGEEIDAVYVWPLFQMPEAEYRRLIDGINGRSLPTFSALGGEDLELGILASNGSQEFFPRLARRVALNVQRILLGEPADQIPVAFSTRDRLTINMGTARQIGVSPTWRLLIEADQIEPIPPDRLRRTLVGTIEEAIAANLDLRAQQLTVAAGAEEIRRARSNLLPQLTAVTQARQIDADRAQSGFGLQPERLWTGSAQLRQLVWSEEAWGNVEIQRQLQEARVQELEALRLDIALEAAVTYVNVLRATRLVQVQRNNLDVSRSNLDLAKIRRTIGAANPAEVYRWESQIATDRKALIEAIGGQRSAEIALNRLLDREQEELFEVADVRLDDPGLMTSDPRFEIHTKTPRRYELFTEFMVERGLAASPELTRLEALVAARERAAASARRAYYSPDLGLAASFERLLSSGGAGVAPPPGFSLLGSAPDDDSWSIALEASLPLFDGGGRAADRIQADQELASLRQAAAATRELVEQRIRVALTQARSSYPGVELAGEAATAARKNLELVADAYARGVVSIIDLLDAQTAALNAEELAANSVYDFLVDLMEVQRSVSRFLVLEPGARDAWFDDLTRYFDGAGSGGIR